MAACTDPGSINSYPMDELESDFLGFHLGEKKGASLTRGEDKYGISIEDIWHDGGTSFWSLSHVRILGYEGVILLSFYKDKLASVSFIFTVQGNKQKQIHRYLRKWLRSKGQVQTHGAPIVSSHMPTVWTVYNGMVIELFSSSLPTGMHIFVLQGSHIGIERLYPNVKQIMAQKRWKTINTITELLEGNKGGIREK